MNLPNNERGSAWHTMPTDAVCSALQTNPTGLSRNEAAARLAQYGPNELRTERRASPWALLWAQITNVLIVILLISIVLSLISGHTTEAVAIAVIVIFSVVLGFIQEYRAERAIEALRQMAAPTAEVLRDGHPVHIPARDVVPGDIILLRIGNKVPADARVLESVNLQTQEAVLTGESTPVEKHSDPLGRQDSPLGDRKNMVYAGTTVTYGRGQAVVVATGMQTEFGKIASLLQTVETSKTPLQRNLDQAGRVMAWTAVIVAASVVILGLLHGQPFVDMLIFGIALAVAIVPEALPAVVTISFAIGIQRMAKRHALLRRMTAVETLGCTSVICSDKTGTLTKDEMTVRRILVAGQVLEVSGAGYDPVGHFIRAGHLVEPFPALQQLLMAAALASDAEIVQDVPGGNWRVQGDPTEGALVTAAAKAGLKKSDLDARFPRVNEIPFTSETKRMITLHAAPEGTVAYAKGAPEVILNACEHQSTEAGVVLLNAEARARILEDAARMAEDGLRVLAVAMRSPATLENAERGMTFLGLMGLMDPPRPEAQTAVQTCERAGIKAVMITGDHPLTAKTIARELGILKTGRVVTGVELESMSDTALEADVERIEVYARVSPAHKLRVISALQKKGHIVAMTGDGVNDAPALKKADIGVAMGLTGTDVARETAAMVLTDDNFASIVAAVEEGRAIFSNITKYLIFVLSTNIGEIALIVGAAVAGLSLPLSAVQILYVNLAAAGLPALALAVDPPEADLMRRKPRDARKGLFTRAVVVLMLVAGLWSALLSFSIFVWALRSGRSQEQAMALTFVSFLIIEFFKAFNFRSDHIPVLRRPFANKWLNLAILWELTLLTLIVHVPFLQKLFGTFVLSAGDLAIIVASAFTLMPVVELIKWAVRRGWLGARN